MAQAAVIAATMGAEMIQQSGIFNDIHNWFTGESSKNSSFDPRPYWTEKEYAVYRSLGRKSNRTAAQIQAMREALMNRAYERAYNQF